MAACVPAFEPPETAVPTLPEAHAAITVVPPDTHGGSILAAVRGATGAAHARIEASPPMRRLLSDDYTMLEYTAHLARLLGFYAPLEEALARAGADAEAPPLASRSRQLRDDLGDLGLTASQIAALPRCEELPSLTGANVLGGRYVYEGAALGGQIISRRLKQSLGAAHRFAFYHEDAGQTGRQWTAFCAYLKTRDGASLRAICDSASGVFAAFADWFEQRPAEDDAHATLTQP